MVKRRVICISCNSALVRNGRDANGKQRYWCSLCRRSSHYPAQSSESILYELFRQYVLFGLTYEVLSYQSKLSVKTLHTAFTTYLERSPPTKNHDKHVLSRSHVLLIDGLWFNRWFVLMMYRETGNLKILRISTDQKELKRNIVYDLLMLSAEGFMFKGVTTDGGKPILGAIQKVHPTLPHQVCLAHMHRAVISNLGRKPTDLRVQFLRQIADLVWYVDTKEKKESWSTLVDGWVERHRDFLQEKRRDDTGRWWYVHRKVKKACSILDAIYFHSFTYIDYPQIPRTTNEIEAQFGHLGKRWLAHRGLSKKRWEIFMKWFVFFYNEEQERKYKKTV